MRGKFLCTATESTTKRQKLLVLRLMSFKLVPLVEMLSTVLVPAFIFLPLVMVNSSHVVLHAANCGKGLGTAVILTPVPFLAAVTELVSGELEPGMIALVTVLTGEWLQLYVPAHMSLQSPCLSKCSATVPHGTRVVSSKAPLPQRT